jgi:hypothetical protein
MIWDWSPDQRQILLSERERPSISLFDLATKKDRVFPKSSDGSFSQGQFSPDEASVTFLRGGASV